MRFTNPRSLVGPTWRISADLDFSNLRLGFHSNHHALHSLKIGDRAIAKFYQLDIRILSGGIIHEQSWFDL